MSDPVVLLSTGDVVGPAGGVTDNSMVLFNGTSGKLIKGNNAVVTAAGLALLDDVNAAAQRVTLGLGTAATANVTTSATDTTAGRVMKVGDFGLGAALNLSYQDLNDTDLETGMYYCGSPVNGPGANGHLWQHRRSSTVIAQYYVTASSTNPKTYFRSMNGTWSVWKELWHSGNQIDLGTTATAAKTVLGLEDVTNTSDANKPVSTAQQTALNLKANLASPTFTGTPLAPTAASGTNTTQVATTAFVQSVVNGYLSKTVTGGTVVLTADELANSAMFFSGALTSNVIIQIANTSNRMYSVSNGTTGAFTLSVRSGTTGTTIPVAQGKRNLVFVSASSAYDAITDFESIALTGVSTCPTALAGTNTTQIASTAFVSSAISTTLSPGAIQMFARSTAPPGWLKANGATISRTTYAALFAAIGTVFGAGDGSTTFKLPDLRGEFLRGWDDARGIDASRSFGSWQEGANESHTHTATATTDAHTHTWSGTSSSAGAHTHTLKNIASNTEDPTGGDCIPSRDSVFGTILDPINTGSEGAHTHTVSGTTSSDTHTHTISVSQQGGTEARPRNIALLTCIKY